MDRRARVLLWLGALLAVAVLAKIGLSSDRSSVHGRPAPKLPTEQLAGAKVTLASLIAGARGRPALVVFWASWCGPCHQEAAALQRFSESPLGRGRLVGVDWSDGLSGARAFVRRYHWTFPNLRDAEGLIGNSYRFPGLPATFVVTSDGRIQALLEGPQTEGSLRRALEGKPS